MAGLSRAQVTRLIARHAASGRVQVTAYRRRRFPQTYTRADIELLALVDEAHETLSGPATRRILEREHQVYGRAEQARLAAISTGHWYNLRKRRPYRERLLNYARARSGRGQDAVRARPTAVSIGQRRKPEPSSSPAARSYPPLRARPRSMPTKRRSTTVSYSASWPPDRKAQTAAVSNTPAASSPDPPACAPSLPFEECGATSTNSSVQGSSACISSRNCSLRVFLSVSSYPCLLLRVFFE